jgi:putative endonuclease
MSYCGAVGKQNLLRVHHGQQVRCSVGVTNNLERRVQEHREGLIPGFTKKYRVRRLLYFEQFEGPAEAIARERQIKGWKRARKLELIHSTNLATDDLSACWSTRDPSLAQDD